MKKMTSGIAQTAIVLIMLAGSFGLSGCNNVENAANSPTVPTDLSSQPPNPPTTYDDSQTTTGNETAPAEPVYVDLSFPNGAPRLNQTAELRCVIEILTPSLTADNVTIKINLPDGLQYVSGDLSAEFGSMTYYSNKTSLPDKGELTAVIKPIRAGNYTIEAKLSLTPRDSDFTLGSGLHRIYLSVSENSSEWGTVPPWLPKVTPPLPITPYEK
jgi:hypothetical protein